MRPLSAARTCAYLISTRRVSPAGGGERGGRERPPAPVVEQGRVARLAHDVVVDAAGFLRREDLALDLLPVHPHGELTHRGIHREGEEGRAPDTEACGGGGPPLPPPGRGPP